LLTPVFYVALKRRTTERASAHAFLAGGTEHA